MFSHIKELFTRPSGYSIARSVRLRSSASAYFNRTPASAGNRQKFTWSAWFKRGVMSDANLTWLFGAGASDETNIYIRDTDIFELRQVTSGAEAWKISTTQVFRDPSSWYHFVVAFDTTQATASNRIKIYVNGVQVTAFSTANYPSQNFNTEFNNTSGQYIGKRASSSAYCDGYFTEINVIDGQQLTPSSFGENDAITGVWKPKKYSGTYGTNGFYLNFSDNSAATAAAIGKDYSGNGNNWTPNNISVTAGATYDSMIDVPTLWGDGSTNRGNYATLNPLLGTGSTYNPQVPTNGNLNIGGGSSKVYSAATITMTSEKWYAEFSITLAASGYPIIGVWSSVPTGTDAYPGHINSTGVSYEANGSRDVNGTNTPSWAATFTTNDIIGVACDANTGKVWFSKNGTWLASGDPANGTTPAATLTSGTYIFGPCASASSGATLSANFGQRPFSYTPPTGFVALNTNNLPVPTIKNGAGYMAATLYTGNVSTQTVNNSAGFYPDFNWIKSRNNAGSHVLVNSVVGGTKQLFSNLTDAEQTNTDITNGISSSGIALGNNISGTGSTNQSAYTYVLWQWKANGSAVTNTAGSITSQVNAGATQGFSVVTYTGNSTSGATVGHGLGVAPKMVIVKARGTPNGIARSWFVYHASLGGTQFIYLDLTSAAQTGSTVWNNTNPSSTVFTLGNENSVNMSANNYVAYCFASVAGFSAFGSYTGNGSADGPFVHLGFRPRFVMIKRYETSSTGNWVIFDTSRNTFNETNLQLWPNSSNGGNSYEATASNVPIDILSNGFKPRTTGADINASSSATYIYACFAENPLKYALAR